METAQETVFKSEYVDSKLNFGFVFPEKFLNWFEPYDIKYTYNGDIEEQLTLALSSCGIVLNEAQKDNLGRVVYIARSMLRDRRNEEQKNRMLVEGWQILTPDIVKQAFQDKKKILLNAKVESDFITTKIDKTYKPFVNERGEAYLMDLKARKRGYYLTQFEKAFCKLV